MCYGVGEGSISAQIELVLLLIFGSAAILTLINLVIENECYGFVLFR